jgi:PAS domain S-box-containing protein
MVISESLEGKAHARFRILPTRSARRYMAISSTFAKAAVADELRRAMQEMADSGELKPVIDRWAFYANPITDTIDEFAAARRRVPWLIAGVVIMSVAAIAMVGLVVRSRRQASRLHQAENLLRGVADRVPGLVYQFRQNPDGTFCLPYASEAIRQLYRISPESVQHDAAGFFAPLHPDDRERVTTSLRQSAEQLGPWVCHYRIRFDDGVERWLAASAVPHAEPDRAIVWHGFITDITERKATEASAQAFERKMQETQKLESLGVLAGGIAHDFNNLLTSILGNTNLASLDAPPQSPVHTHLEPIKRGCLRAAELCKQLLAYSGKGRFVVEKVDLHALLDETTELLRHSISKQCELRFNRAPQLPPVEGDIAQLRQVIMNLIINASEAIGAAPGMITVTTRVVAGALDESSGTGTTFPGNAGARVCLEITDTGSGMSEETKARIFEPFFTTKFTGRGLGLAAVHGIVRGHRGLLKVESELGRGTTFALQFPAAEGVADPLDKPVEAPVAWLGSGCVLVVDDEEAVRQVCSALLGKLGFTVVLAADGRTGIEAFQAEPDRYALVLLDLTMPQPDGRQVFSELRLLRENPRVVLMSGFNEEEVLSEFAGIRLAGFLQKPFEMDSFRNVIRRASGTPASNN